MKLEKKLTAHLSSVMCVRFSPDGQFLASSGGDKLAFLYELPSGNVLAKIEHHNSYVATCAFSRSAKRLATGSNDKQIVVWKLNPPDTHCTDIQSATETTLEELFTRESSVTSTDYDGENEIEFSHASILSEKDDISMMQRIPIAHNSDINDLVFIKEKEFVSVSSDKSLRLWSLVACQIQQMKSIEVHNNPMYSMCTNNNPASKLVTTALDGSIGLWDLPSLELSKPLFKSESSHLEFENASPKGIRVCRSSNDGQKMITAGDDDGANVWSMESGECINRLFNGGHSNTVFMACFIGHDGSLAVTGCNDGYLKVWNVKEETVLHTIEEAHDLGVVCGATKPKREGTLDESYTILVTGGNDTIIKIWKVFEEVAKLGSIELVQELNGHGSTVMSVSFSPKTGKYFASTSGDKTVRIWNSDSLVCLKVLDGR